MQATFTMDSAANLVRLKYVGKVTLEDKLHTVEEIISHPDFRRGMNAVCDLTEATFDWNLREVDKFRSYMDTLKAKTGEVQWAIISTGGITHITVKIFLLLHEAFGDTIEAKLFSNPQDAEEWLSIVDSNRPV